MPEWTPDGEAPELPEGHSTVDHVMAMVPQMIGHMLGSQNLHQLVRMVVELHGQRLHGLSGLLVSESSRTEIRRESVDDVMDILVTMTNRLQSLNPGEATHEENS